jgi:hypothetical protein
MMYTLEDWKAILEGWEIDLRHAEESVEASFTAFTSDLKTLLTINATTVAMRAKVAAMEASLEVHP